MKKVVCMLIAVLMFVFVGCASASEGGVSKEELTQKYVELLNEKNALEQEYNSLKSEYDQIKSEKDKIEADGEFFVEYWKLLYVCENILYVAETTGTGDFYIESAIPMMAEVYDLDEEEMRECIEIRLETQE